MAMFRIYFPTATKEDGNFLAARTPHACSLYNVKALIPGVVETKVEEDNPLRRKVAQLRR